MDLTETRQGWKNTGRLPYICCVFFADVGFFHLMPCFCTFSRSIPTWNEVCGNFPLVFKIFHWVQKVWEVLWPAGHMCIESVLMWIGSSSQCNSIFQKLVHAQYMVYCKRRNLYERNIHGQLDPQKVSTWKFVYSNYMYMHWIGKKPPQNYRVSRNFQNNFIFGRILHSENIIGKYTSLIQFWKV